MFLKAVLNIHLPAARTPEQTHAQIQVVPAINIFSNHKAPVLLNQKVLELQINCSHPDVLCICHVQVYFVTVDKKSKAVSLSHAKDNKVQSFLKYYIHQGVSVRSF